MESNNSVGKEDLRRLVSMVCDQFSAGFAGRNEFIDNTINEWEKSLPLSPQSSVGVEEILLKHLVPDCCNTDFEAKEYLVHVWDEIIAAMTEYSSLMNKDASIIKEELLKLANSMDAYVDFSDKTYDGDKEAPMDAVGFIHHLAIMNRDKDREIEQLKTSLEMTQLGWSATTDKKEEWENQAKALSAIKKGLEKSYSQLQQLLSEKEKEIEELKRQLNKK